MQEDQQNGMTMLMFQYAVNEHPSLKEAKEKLRDDAYTRTVSEVLTHYCGADESNLRKTITDLLCETIGSRANRESIGHKVRGWLNRKKTSIDKESAVQLAFALKLNLSDAEEMLCRLSDENFHWRDPDDIVLLFALEHKMLYCDACDLLERMRLLCKDKTSPESPDTMTGDIKPRIERIQTEEELADFLITEAPKLGKMHNTAYDLYINFMNLLSDNGNMSAGGEKRDSDENIASNILNNYLHRRSVPVSDNVSKFLKDALQRSIKKNWPDKARLSHMKNRNIDVTRKVLILLFLACDGGETVYGSLSEESPEDIFDDTYARLTAMLLSCGFPPLDSRNPFDWMVLYCIATADDVIDIDDNIRNFLSEIFDTSEETAD